MTIHYITLHRFYTQIYTYIPRKKLFANLSKKLMKIKLKNKQETLIFYYFKKEE